MSAPELSVAGPRHNAEPISPKVLAEAVAYLRAVEIPDDVAALRRLYGEQSVLLVKMLGRIEALEARLARLERRT